MRDLVFNLNLKSLVVLAALQLLLVPTIAGAAAGSRCDETRKAVPKLYCRGMHEIGVSFGYGVGFQVGAPNPELEDTRFIVLSPRLGILSSNPLGEGRWYESNFQLLAEATLLTQHEPKKGVAGGGGLLFRMNFLGARERYALVPYIDYGMGMVSLDFDLRDQDDGWAFTLLVGAGLRRMLDDRSAVSLEWRYHHISNADTHGENHGINTHIFALSYSFFY